MGHFICVITRVRRDFRHHPREGLDAQSSFPAWPDYKTEHSAEPGSSENWTRNLQCRHTNRWMSGREPHGHFYRLPICVECCVYRSVDFCLKLCLWLNWACVRYRAYDSSWWHDWFWGYPILGLCLKRFISNSMFIISVVSSAACVVCNSFRHCQTLFMTRMDRAKCCMTKICCVKYYTDLFETLSYWLCWSVSNISFIIWLLYSWLKWLYQILWLWLEILSNAACDLVDFSKIMCF